MSPLPPGLAALVREALARRPHASAVVRFHAADLEVVDREALARELEPAVAHALREARVPEGHALALVGDRVALLDAELALVPAPGDAVVMFVDDGTEAP